MSKTDIWPIDQAALAALIVAHRLAAGRAETLHDFVRAAPAFAGLPDDRLAAALARAEAMAEAVLDTANGVETLLELVGDALRATHGEAAYLLVADYIALNQRVSPEEMRFLERLGQALKIDRLRRAAFDQAARTRTIRLIDKGAENEDAAE